MARTPEFAQYRCQLYRGNEESVDELLQHADMAMYQAKESGRNAVRFFDPVMQNNVAHAPHW